MALMNRWSKSEALWSSRIGQKGLASDGFSSWDTHFEALRYHVKSPATLKLPCQTDHMGKSKRERERPEEPQLPSCLSLPGSSQAGHGYLVASSLSSRLPVIIKENQGRTALLSQATLRTIRDNMASWYDHCYVKPLGLGVINHTEIGIWKSSLSP